MNGRHLGAVLAGGLTLFFVGFLIYGLALGSFLQEHAGGLLRDPPLVWMIGLGDLVFAGFLTLIFSRQATLPSFGGGFTLGGLVGLLTSLSSGLIQYATHAEADFAATIVNTIAFAVLAASAGGVITMVLGRRRV